MKELLLFLLLSLISIYNGNASTLSTTGKGVINGKILSGNTGSIQFILIDSPLNNDFPPFYTAKTDNNGYFKIILPAKHFTEGVIVIGNFRNKIVLLPGDDMNLTFKNGVLSYQGKGSEKNNFLSSLKVNNLANLTPPTDKNTDLTSFANLMKKKKEERLAFLKNYPAQKKLEPEFKNWFNIDTEVLYETHMLRFLNGKNQLSPVYEKIKNPGNLLNDRKLISRSYLDLINDNCLSEQSIRPMIKELTAQGISEKEARRTARNNILETFPSKTKEYVLAQMIIRQLTRSDLFDTAQIKLFEKIAKDNSAIEAVEEAKNKWSIRKSIIGQPLHPEFSQTQLNDTASNALTFGEMLEKHKGKVIYLDIWSLGCGPCRAAMPGSQLLRKKMINQPVAFVYIVPDNYPNQWNQIRRLTGTLENNYQLTNGFNSRLMRFMERNWIPVYMIFDKKGHLVTYNAESPMYEEENGESRLYKLLRELAEE